MSCVMRKPDICICETESQISCSISAHLDKSCTCLFVSEIPKTGVFRVAAHMHDDQSVLVRQFLLIKIHSDFDHCCYKQLLEETSQYQCMHRPIECPFCTRNIKSLLLLLLLLNYILIIRNWFNKELRATDSIFLLIN